MQFKLLVLSKTSFSYVSQGFDEFCKRINHYYKFEYSELVLPKKLASAQSKKLKEYEADHVLKHLNSGDYLILLDEKGVHYNSMAFAEWIEKKLNLSYKSIVFVVGGAYGFDKKLYDRSNALLSLSKMTYSHQLIRLIFAEQFYRACTIIKNEKYHND